MIEVDVVDGSTTASVSAKVCSRYEVEGYSPADGPVYGAGCGFTWTSTTDPAATFATFFLELYTDGAPALEAGETPYVWARLPGRQGSSTSKIFGLSVAQN
jgi:hypothetical protein